MPAVLVSSHVMTHGTAECRWRHGVAESAQLMLEERRLESRETERPPGVRSVSAAEHIRRDAGMLCTLVNFWFITVFGRVNDEV